MKAINLQLSRLTMVSSALMAALSEYQNNQDEVGEREVKSATEALSKVIRFLTTINKALKGVGPDICPNCGHDLGE